MARKEKTPRAPTRAQLPLLRFRPGGVSQVSVTRGAPDRLSLGWERAGERASPSQRRIRLVAYGARLESVLGESPRGFESPILREI